MLAAVPCLQRSPQRRYWVEVLVFTRADASTPWLVAEDSGFPAVMALGQPVQTAYDAPVPTAERARAVHIAAQFAALWQQAKDTGRIPTPHGFDLSESQTDDRFQSLAAHRQNGLQVNGLYGHYTFYAASADPLFQVNDADVDLACQPIRETVIWRPRPDYLIYQSPDRTLWGPYVKPGYYRRVVDQSVWETCFLICPQRSDPVVVLNQDIPGVSSTGLGWTPIPATQTAPVA